MRKLLLLFGFTAVLALALGAAARAIPPEHFPVVHVDETETIRAHARSQSRSTPWAMSGTATSSTSKGTRFGT